MALAEDFLDDEEKPKPKTASAEDFLSESGSRDATAFLDEQPQQPKTGSFVDETVDKAKEIVPRIAQKATDFLSGAAEAAFPATTLGVKAYQKVEPIVRPYVEAPVTGLGGLVQLGQGKSLEEAAQGIREGKTVGDVVTESIPEPETPSVAENFLGNLGREALGGITNLATYAGAFEAPERILKFRPPVPAPPPPEPLPQLPAGEAPERLALPPPSGVEGPGFRMADTPDLGALQHPAPAPLNLPSRTTPVDVVPYKQNPIERLGQEDAAQSMAYDEALRQKAPLNREVPEYQPFTPETRHPYADLPSQTETPQPPVGAEPKQPLSRLAGTEDRVALDQALENRPNDPTRAGAQPFIPATQSADFERALPPEDQGLVAKTRERLQRTPSTRDLHTDPVTGEYDPQRQAVHEKIINSPEFTRPETVAKPEEQPVARLVIGPPGAGKTTAIQKVFNPEELKRSVVLDNDEIKAKLPNYDPSVAGAYHAEASDIHRQVALNVARNRQNFVDQIVGRSTEDLQRRIRLLKDLGYRVELYLVDLDPKKAAQRALDRYKETGRFVDPKYILDEVGLKPRNTYDRLKSEVDAYGHIETDVPPGQAPRVLENSSVQPREVLRRPGGLPESRDERGPREARGGTQSESPEVTPPQTPEPDLGKLYPKASSGEEGFVRVGGEPSSEESSVLKRQLYDRYEPIKYQGGSEIAPEAPQAGGQYTKSYVDARTLSGRIKARGGELLGELNQITEPLRNFKDREALNKIYTLRNFADLDRAGKTTSGVTADVAEKELAKLKGELGDERFNRIAGVADQIADIQNNKALDILVEGNVISPETAKTLRERYPNYLRSEILDEQLAGEHPELRSGDNAEPIGRVNKSFLKEKKGTEKIINTDVLDVVRRSLLTKVAAAEKQKTIDTIASQFGKEIGGSILKDGKFVAEYDPAKIPTGWVKSNIKASSGKIYAVRKDVEDMLQGLNREQMDLVTKTMSSFNRVFKGGATTYRAPFVLSNLFRDVQEFLVKGRRVEGQNNRVVSLAKGMLASVQDSLHDAFPKWIPENGLAKAWKEQGGGFGGVMTSLGREKPIPIRLLSGKDQLYRFAGRVAMLPFQPIRIPAEVMENATRLGEFARLKDTKLPESLKVLNSRDVTVDFEKMGDAMRVWNNAIPFLNPMVQGNINILRTLRDQPIVTAGKVASYILTPQIALYQYNRRFKNDDLIDPYIKDNFWYINTGATREVNGREVPIIWTVRKGETAQLVSNPVRRALEYYSKDPNFQNALDDYSWSGLAGTAANTLVPPLLKVPFEEAANYDTFKRGPIVPDRLNDVKPGQQFSSGTTNTARVIGEKTGISPVRLEHVAQGLYPASKQALEASDALLQPDPTIPRREKDVLERSRTFQPFIRTPSGYFSQEEDAAKRFEKSQKETQRTPAFLYEEARRRYFETREEEDRQRMIELSKDVPGEERIRINRKLNEQLREKAMTPEQRAPMLVPRKYRKLFRKQQAQADE